MAAKKEDFVVVIDAGHGGNDTGAVDNGVKEKDINLGVALALGDLIKKRMKDAKVVYTRDKDNFITLQGRADKANSAKGDVFISIHTNSVDASNKNRTTVNGASTYVLGLHKDKENMAVARRENSVISLEKNSEEKYGGFDPDSDESYIIFEMVQKQDLNRSIKLASEIQKGLHSEAGRKDRGVHQAGFWVLWATSMPAVLVELDFICNPNSAKYIASSTGQQKLAQGIFNALKNYRAMEKKLAEEEKAAAEDPAATGKPEVVLAAAQEHTPKVSEGDVYQKNTVTGKRRRRSGQSRKNSDRRTIAEAVLAEEKPAVVELAYTETESMPAETPKLVAPATKQKKETKKSKESADKKSDAKAKASAKKADQANKQAQQGRKVTPSKMQKAQEPAKRVKNQFAEKGKKSEDAKQNAAKESNIVKQAKSKNNTISADAGHKKNNKADEKRSKRSHGKLYKKQSFQN